MLIEEKCFLIAFLSFIFFMIFIGYKMLKEPLGFIGITICGISIGIAVLLMKSIIWKKKVVVWHD